MVVGKSAVLPDAVQPAVMPYEVEAAWAARGWYTPQTLLDWVKREEVSTAGNAMT